MTKVDFVREWAGKVKKEIGLEISDRHAKVMYELLVQMVIDQLQKKNEVLVSGLGIFKIKDRAARTGRNPKTGEAIKIAAKKAVVFKAVSAVKKIFEK